MFDLRSSLNARTLARRAGLRMGSTVAGTSAATSPTAASRRCSTTSRSTSARRRSARRPCCAASPTCRPTTASGTRAAAPARCRGAGAPGPRAGRRDPARHGRPADRASGRAGVEAITTERGERAAGRRRGLQHRRRADVPRAARRRGRPALRARAPPRAGLLGRRALPRPRPRLRPPAAPQLRLLRRPDEEFDSIYRKGEPAPDPTCYLAAPARTDPAVAPPGGEALYVLVHTPYLRPHHDWKAMLPAYRRIILDKLARDRRARRPGAAHPLRGAA